MSAQNKILEWLVANAGSHTAEAIIEATGVSDVHAQCRALVDMDLVEQLDQPPPNPVTMYRALVTKL